MSITFPFIRHGSQHVSMCSKRTRSHTIMESMTPNQLVSEILSAQKQHRKNPEKCEELIPRWKSIDE